MAAGDAYKFPGFLTQVLTQISFRSHRLLFSHASAEVRGKNTPGHKSDTLTTKPPGRGTEVTDRVMLGEKKDPSARMCSLILFYTPRKIKSIVTTA